MTKKRGGAENPDVTELTDAWGISIDPELLILALTHRSFANEMGGLPNNERLEFLGDSVLSIIATEDLYRTHADSPESQLAKMRSAVVSQRPLAALARQIDLGSYILLGVGENKTGGREKDSILSDTVEAIIGATYLTHGLEPTRVTLLRHLRPFIEVAGDVSATLDWKTPLREYTARRNLGEVTFEVTGSGPDHDRRFHAKVLIAGVSQGDGDGTSRKDAETQAAKGVYLRLTGAIETGGESSHA